MSMMSQIPEFVLEAIIIEPSTKIGPSEIIIGVGATGGAVVMGAVMPDLTEPQYIIGDDGQLYHNPGPLWDGYLGVRSPNHPNFVVGLQEGVIIPEGDDEAFVELMNFLLNNPQAESPPCRP